MTKHVVVDQNLVSHVADLARIELSSEELLEMRQELEQILEHFESIQSVESVSAPHDESSCAFSFTEQHSQFNAGRREDVVTESFDARDLLANAPKKKNGQFALDAVIEEM